MPHAADGGHDVTCWKACCGVIKVYHWTGSIQMMVWCLELSHRGAVCSGRLRGEVVSFRCQQRSQSAEVTIIVERVRRSMHKINADTALQNCTETQPYSTAITYYCLAACMTEALKL